MSISIKKIFSLLFLSILLSLPLNAADETVIKFASLAPEGSTWMKVMQEWNKKLIEKSGGKLKFRIYSGGVSGDEKDVVRKIRLGQLHAGGFTGVGLGEIAPEVRIMDAPFLFQSSDEVDHVQKVMDESFNAAFQKNGYVLLGWAEVGFVYFFTSKPVQNLTDLKSLKMWVWEGDPIAESAYRALGVSPIPLSITDVMSSLQTGLIEGVYSSPLAAIALQWFTRTKFVYDYHLANASGAVLISKKFFDAMPKDQQELLKSTGRDTLAELTLASRKENQESIETLKKNGVKFSAPPSKEVVEQYKMTGAKARKNLAGKLYSQEALDKVEKALLEYRTVQNRIKP